MVTSPAGAALATELILLLLVPLLPNAGGGGCGEGADSADSKADLSAIPGLVFEGVCGGVDLTGGGGAVERTGGGGAVVREDGVGAEAVEGGGGGGDLPNESPLEDRPAAAAATLPIPAWTLGLLRLLRKDEGVAEGEWSVALFACAFDVLVQCNTSVQNRSSFHYIIQ